MRQNSDRFTLEEALMGMRELGVAPEEFVVGYEDGVRGLQMDEAVRWDGDQLTAYRRGVKAGRQAKERGAHERSEA